MSSSTRARQAPKGITFANSGLRSTNLERDLNDADLSTILIGVRAQDVLERVTAALNDQSRLRAWSLTGPYGSGKSTIALVVGCLLSRDAARRSEADKALGDASPVLARRLAEAREARAPEGMLTCVATARREPLTATLSRAFRYGVEQAWGRRPPRDVKEALAGLTGPEVTNDAILAAIRVLCAHGPVLVAIDEFGKSLEYLASRGDFADGDVYLLQELAELGAGARGQRLYLLTLQHQSFADYASRATTLQTLEWAKIQGRFEDVQVTTHLGDAVELLRRTLDHSRVSPKGRRAIAEHASASVDAWASRGLHGLLPADKQLFTDLYPLHPLTAVVASLLAGQIGQHDRSLAGFLAGDEPHTVRRFLTDCGVASPTAASTVRLADAFDYFFTAGRTTILASANASRWMEIERVITEANGMDEDDQAILKTIGMLNLVDVSGALRASMDMILFALCDPSTMNDRTVRERWHARVRNLLRESRIVYRGFSDEYRVWRGSDVDLSEHIDYLMKTCDDHAAVKLVSDYLPAAVVAGAHSQRTGMLRHFDTRAVDAASGEITGPSATDLADGLLLFHFGDLDNLPAVRTDRPVIAGVTSDAQRVLGAARYLHALRELPDHVVLDPVASHEVSERTTQAGAELATRVAEAFSPTRLRARWFLLANDGGISRPAGATELSGRSLAALVSSACDQVYPLAPHIRSEMLGRHTLTSQGAKARRELMAAMVNAPEKRHLDIEGFGPERAMYHGVLAYLGLHKRLDDGGSRYGFAEPSPDSSLYPAWTALMREIQHATKTAVTLDQIHALLEAPPYGVRPGLVPIITLTALIIGREEIALFEDGTYQPRLTDALVERMVKNPARFGVKAMGTQTGQRRAVVVAIAEQLGTRFPPAPPPNARNTAPLAVTRSLLDRARTLSAYADRTTELSPAARAVRTALKTAREPDTLLFADLPAALGLPAVPIRGRTDPKSARAYAEALTTALVEITTADQRLRHQVIAVLADAFHAPSEPSKLRRQLRALTEHLRDVNLADPKLRGFVAIAQDDQLGIDEWLDPLVVRIAGRGLSDWRDGDVTHLRNEARAIAKAVERLVDLNQTDASTPADPAYTARSIVLTRPDGHEERAVIQIPAARHAAVEELARAVIRQAREKIGEHGERLLLAVLAENVMAKQDTGPAPATRQRRNSKS